MPRKVPYWRLQEIKNEITQQVPEGELKKDLEVILEYFEESFNKDDSFERGYRKGMSDCKLKR